jgi:hypothetical protein
MNSIVEGALSDDVEREQPNYRSYLLRLWWAEDDATTALRILIEDSATGQRTGFSSLEDLVAFLSKEAKLNAHS